MRLIRFLTSAFLLNACFSLSTFSQPDHIGRQTSFPGHPRILLLAGEEAIVKRNNAADPIWQNLHEAILSGFGLMATALIIGYSILASDRKCSADNTEKR